ncbi:MAG: tRNA-(ms[2]io[6]A)-hydroxylase [Pseudomonadales bacterium]|nr:tRNA-(ms[2]io[6]A)-hydroxylase [Pseudomonadales bacterium]MBO6563552.1 tRNA-(ms[2]io[6]A)-hydroxylase [Pseudomonadales bacterium]MBO6594341.1 tRNA-(ms[2]io[6]A)-hydroxylase [Pseudomonadales bacterium]MBO6657481.1 tRNA-(ms[2]io[6]A)-hydroxylase [Pseudomonadales bacterium]MBO6700842.1 tRNA-(ms[2]io[6]A)-hydroxylase [Pseudomonadales bacterium]
MTLTLASSPAAWAECVCNNFDEFLADHAANERKASSMAMSLVAHYPDRERLVSEMVDLALEELNHFKQVVKLMQSRNLVMPPDQKDTYVNDLRAHVRQGSDDYFLDRLLSAAVIEARGEERFRLLAETLVDEKLAAFYSALANSEAGHHQLFLDLAKEYFPIHEVEQRTAEWIAVEQTVMEDLPIHSRLH